MSEFIGNYVTLEHVFWTLRMICIVWIILVVVNHYSHYLSGYPFIKSHG